jgi:hypothetical protein
MPRKERSPAFAAIPRGDVTTLARLFKIPAERSSRLRNTRYRLRKERLLANASSSGVGRWATIVPIFSNGIGTMPGRAHA